MYIFKKIFVYSLLFISNAYVKAAEEPKLDLFSGQSADTILHSQEVELKNTLQQLAPNTELADQKTKYRALLVFQNWCEISGGPPNLANFPTELINQERLSNLPLLSKEFSMDPNIKYLWGKLLELVLDQHDYFVTFYLQDYSPYIPPLLQTSKSLRRIGFMSGEMNHENRKNIFDALSQQKSVISVDFMCRNLIEKDVQYLCQNTSTEWRAQVESLDFSLFQCEFKLTSECLSLILATFPNLNNFKSNSGLILDGPLTIPLMTSLKALDFYNDSISQDTLQKLKDSLLHLTALSLIHIGSTHLGDQSVTILISMKKERPTLELDCFQDTGISDVGLKEIVQVFTELNYPQKINTGIVRSKFVDDYNLDRSIIINRRRSKEVYVSRPVDPWWEPRY